MYKGASRFIQHRLEHAHGERKLKIGQVIPLWMKKALKLKKPRKGNIIAEIKGGYTINLDGYRAFCPYSEMSPHPPSLSKAVLKSLKSQPVEYVIIKIEQNSVVVSRKQAIQLQTLTQNFQTLSDGTAVSVDGKARHFVPEVGSPTAVQSIVNDLRNAGIEFVEPK